MTQDQSTRSATPLRPRNKQNLRLWLRLLACSSLIKRGISTRLKTQQDSTLPRFDFMAVLYRSEGQLTMGEVSHYLMVSNGHVTGLADRLERDGLIRRWQLVSDRRTYYVALTPEGRHTFETMAREHEQWMGDYMAALDDKEVETLVHLLGKLKTGIETQ